MSDRTLPLAHTPERATSEGLITRILLIGIAGMFLVLVLFLPLVIVFVEGFRKGGQVFF